MSAPDLRTALQAGYIACFSGTPPPTSYENNALATTGVALWTSFIFLPGEPTPATFGIGGEDAEYGILQVDINIPKNTGEKPLFDTVKTIQNFFTAGRIFTYNSGNATVIAAGASHGRLVDTWYRRSVSIRYHSRTTRPDPN